MSPLRDALDRIDFARNYTWQFLSSLPQSSWFRMEPGGVTHIAWQVGHLAFAQYRLGLHRIRGIKPEDESLISSSFLEAFSRDSVPSPDPAAYPPTDVIRTTFDRVHLHLLAELAAYPEDRLGEPVDPPHRIASTKLECLHWCAAHELVHAGQLALLRRQLGLAPVW
jgi:hypothetical protein